MSNSNLANNVITFIFHAFIAIIMFCLFRWVAQSDNPLFQPNSLLPKIIGITCLLAYVVCGFLLKPVENQSFLSVISVAIVLLILFFVFALFIEGDSKFGYYYVNPTMQSFSWLFRSNIVSGILFFLSPLIPSLLMYLGMVLRKCFRR